MLYPTHPVAGYLLAVVFRLPVVPVVVGAALPDLVDKPLGILGVVDQYHTVAHSVFALVVPLALAARNRAWLAVAAGWASHLALDAAQMVINGRPGDARFLLWPAVEHESQVQLPPVEFAAFYVGTRASAVELLVWVGALAALARRRLLED